MMRVYTPKMCFITTFVFFNLSLTAGLNMQSPCKKKSHCLYLHKSKNARAAEREGNGRKEREKKRQLDDCWVCD